MSCYRPCVKNASGMWQSSMAIRTHKARIFLYADVIIAGSTSKIALVLPAKAAHRIEFGAQGRAAA